MSSWPTKHCVAVVDVRIKFVASRIVQESLTLK
jgi:hypothetical protein